MSTNGRHVPHAQQHISHQGALPATPDISEIEQERDLPEHYAVLVEHNGPLATRPLPTRAGNPTTVIVPATGAPVLGRDLRRARVTLLSTDNAFYYASKAPATWSTATAALWPANVPLVLLHGDAISCACSTAGVSTIAVIPENMDGN